MLLVGSYRTANSLASRAVRHMRENVLWMTSQLRAKAADFESASSLTGDLTYRPPGAARLLAQWNGGEPS